MGFLDKFFGESQETADQYRDWLLNGVEQLEEHFEKNSQGSTSNLQAFTTIGTYYTGALLIHLDKKIASEIIDVLCRIRGLYDCFWQLHLLKDNEKQRVGKIYAMHEHKVQGLIESLWEESPNAKSLFVPAFGDYYSSNFLVGDVEEYIQNSEGPEYNIMFCAGLIGLECQIGKKAGTIADIIEETLNLDRVNKYLEAFDIDEFIDLPEEFFE